MGRPKLLLRVGAKTVLELVVCAVQDAGVSDVLVVVAPADDDLAQCAESAGAHVLRLDADTPDMRTTSQRGLDWLEARFQPTAVDGWLLLPADHPTVKPDVIRAILAAAANHAIVVPVHQGRRGHPTWLAWSHVAGIRALPSDRGLNSYIRANSESVREIEWPSDEILRDLDTPEDYARLLQDPQS